MADLLCEFLEIAVHSILYTRKIYPEAIFVPKKVYGTVAYQSEHPLLNKYITDALKAAHFHLKHNQLKKFYVCIVSDKTVVERYTFNISHFIENSESDPVLLTLEQHLRTLCLKLNLPREKQSKLPDDAEFIIQMQTTEYSALSLNESSEYSEFPWIPIEESCSTVTPVINPIHNVNIESFGMEVFVEELPK